MQTNRNASCLSLKRYGHRPAVHNPLSGYFERRRVQEYRGRREKSGGSDPHTPDLGGAGARTRNGKGGGSYLQPPAPWSASARKRNGKGGGSDPHPPNSGGASARTRNGKGSSLYPYPPCSRGFCTVEKPRMGRASGNKPHGAAAARHAADNRHTMRTAAVSSTPYGRRTTGSTQQRQCRQRLKAAPERHF